MKISNYTEEISKILGEAQFSLDKVLAAINQVKAAGKKIIFIGNGGSATTANHMALDYSKLGKIRSISFDDGSFLTMLGNDYGFENSFAKAIEMYGDTGDLLIALSGSGRSPNILKAVEASRNKGLKVITLSGFQPDNPLSQLGDINIHFNSQVYGPVEISHLIFLHWLLDKFFAQG